MKLSNSLLKLACILPATLILAESLQASPYRNVSISSVSNRTATVRVIGSNNQYHYQLVSTSTQNQSYGFIGVAIEPLTPERAEWINDQQEGGFNLFNLFQGRPSVPEVEGVLIVRTLEDGPAELAGLQDGDVLMGVHGQMVSDVRQVQQLIGRTSVGGQVPVTFQRKNKVHTVMVSTGDGRVLRPMMQAQLR